MTNAMITVITPVRNNADVIGDCLRSIKGQTTACQHIIVDGGSSDGTLEIIRQHRAAGAVLISEPDQGMYDAINKGLALATSEVVGILNADDFFPTSDALDKIALAFTDPAVEASYGDLLYVDRADTTRVTRTWRSGDYRRDRLYAGWMPPHPTFYLRRRLYQEHGGYRLDLGTAADYELMLRMLLKHQVAAAYIPRVLVHMRTQGMSNASISNRLKANRHDRAAWRVNGLRPRPWTLIAKPLRKVGQWFDNERI
jgi:glycosyltransferase involved in cell wall biosynthesis